jgi:hypothetical protein
MFQFVLNLIVYTYLKVDINLTHYLYRHVRCAKTYLFLMPSTASRSKVQVKVQSLISPTKLNHQFIPTCTVHIHSKVMLTFPKAQEKLFQKQALVLNNGFKAHTCT